jgi:hypothetical protein
VMVLADQFFSLFLRGGSNVQFGAIAQPMHVLLLVSPGGNEFADEIFYLALPP